MNTSAVYTQYTYIKTRHDNLNSIAPYYAVDPFWMSLRGDRVGEATPRHGRPYNKFTEAKYYGHTNRGGRT